MKNSKNERFIVSMIGIVVSVFFVGCSEEEVVEQEGAIVKEESALDITDFYPKTLFSNVYKGWDEIGEYYRNEIVSYTNDNGATHYYEVVELPGGDVEWLCAAYLAQISGGYLVCPETEDENEFVFYLIDDEIDWYVWDGTEVTNGPPIGGFQSFDLAEEDDPAEGWMWLSGESMEYTNWCQNLDDGILDCDDRDNTQPNDASGGNQDVMCFGEITSNVSFWGDFPARFGDLDGGDGATFYAFVIEYNSDPEQE